jgi:hypothetical protein
MGRRKGAVKSFTERHVMRHLWRGTNAVAISVAIIFLLYRQKG